jgi:NADPH:quinone reductase-like Zn-dependent oxidoreductase
MKAYKLLAEEGLAALSLTEQASPEVSANDVKVRVRAVALNYRDLIVAKGAKKANRITPITPVSDGAGEVIAVGENVKHLKAGDRVMASFFPTWIDGPLSDHHHANALGGGSINGMLAEEVVLDQSVWLKVPEHLSFAQASTLPCAGLTAWHALFEAANLRPGDTILLQGTGGVSILALQLARAAGATVLMTSSSEEKAARAKALGASEVFDYRKNPAWGEAAKTWTNGRGVDIAVEVGGPGTFDQTISSLRYGGTMSILGVLTGTRGEVNTYAIFHKTLRVFGIYVGSVAMFHRLNRALDASKIEPVIDKSFDFDQAKEAYEYLQSGSHFGKVVVRV